MVGMRRSALDQHHAATNRGDGDGGAGGRSGGRDMIVKEEIDRISPPGTTPRHTTPRILELRVFFE